MTTAYNSTSSEASDVYQSTHGGRSFNVRLHCGRVFNVSFHCGCVFDVRFHCGRVFNMRFHCEWAFNVCFHLSLIHISEPTRQSEISYAVFCWIYMSRPYSIPLLLSWS